MDGQVKLIRLSDFHYGIVETPDKLDMDGLMIVRFEIDGAIYDVSLIGKSLNVHSGAGVFYIHPNSTNDLDIEISKI